MSDHPKKGSTPSAETPKPSLRHGVEQLSVPEITALIEFAQKTLRQKQEAERDALVAEFRERATSIGLSLEALITQSGKQARPVKATARADKLPPKYRGPNGEEWSGRGRTPTWLTAYEAKGQNREEFKV